MKMRVSFIVFSLLNAVFLWEARGQAVIGNSTGSTAFGPTGGNSVKSVQSAPLSNIKSAITKLGPLAQWGPIAVRPHLSYSLIYGNGLLRVPGEPENTTLQTISPGILLEFGSHVNLDYTLTRNTHSSRLLFDTTDHNARLDGNIGRGDWRFGASQAYGSNSPTLVETGRQTAERTYSTSATVAYELGPRSLIDVSLNRFVRSANPLLRSDTWTGSDWTQWSASAWLRYSLSQELDVSLGFQTGYDEISDNPDMSSTQPQIEIRWLPTEKLSLNGKLGFERRESKTSVETQIQKNTVYSASLRYQILRTTGLSFGANRNIAAAYFSDQITKSEGWTLGLDQRLFTRIYGSASYSRGRTDYIPTTLRPYVERDDDYDSYSLNLSTPLLRRGTASVFFSRSRNRSNSQGFGFATNQVGTTFSYRF